jgi:hypothetical protein
MKNKPKVFSYGLSISKAVVAAVTAILVYPAQAADKRPNIVMR